MPTATIVATTVSNLTALSDRSGNTTLIAAVVAALVVLLLLLVVLVTVGVRSRRVQHVSADAPLALMETRLSMASPMTDVVPDRISSYNVVEPKDMVRE
jgi:hypothetical protein